MTTKIENIKNDVNKLLNRDNSGHGPEHVNQVLYLSLKFAETEKANKDIVSLTALLHDVDDYKLFGIENSNHLTNAKHILNQYDIDKNTQKLVLDNIESIGYSKRLKGICPLTLEGMIVSDADMCDAIGANGIIRAHQFSLSKNNTFFDRHTYPVLDMSSTDYMSKKGTTVNHMFEKLLKLKDMMLTNSGKKEATKRHNTMVAFLRNFFQEENVPEWNLYLDNYLNKEYEKQQIKDRSGHKTVTIDV